MIFNLTTVLRKAFNKYLPKIAASIATVDARVVSLEKLVKDMKGDFISAEDTLGAFVTTDNSGNPIGNGDWSILKVDDGTNEAGLYIFDGTDWVMAVQIPDIGDILGAVIADDATYLAGLATDKAPSVKQVNTTIEDLKTRYHPKEGDETLYVVGKDAEIDTQQFVTAKQMAGEITDAEAQEDWDNV